MCLIALFTTPIHCTCRANEFPFAEDGCLQHILKGAGRRKVRMTGVTTSMRLHQDDIKIVKYYEERFANGPDLQDQRYERSLSVAEINASR